MWDRLRLTRRQGQRFAAAVTLVALSGGATGYWVAARLPEQIAAGRELFVHEWTADDPLANQGDGLGPVFNANSCVACHFQGGVGGAGSNEHNVTGFEVLPNRLDDTFRGGVVHASATRADLQETTQRVGSLYPVVPGGKVLVGTCFRQVADFDPVRFSTVNTPALFGTGLIDTISSTAIKRNVNWRRMAGVANEIVGKFDDTPAGRVRILDDGRVGRFGWKAQFATLEEFVAAACAVEVGLTNPYRSQDVPRLHTPDADAELDMTRREFKNLVAFCRHLDRPQRAVPSSRREQHQAARGERLFTEVGCADCHTPDLGRVQGIYSDLALHRIENPDLGQYREILEIPIPSHIPDADEWKTPPLWGVADSAPYWHDGSAPTLESAIARHHGQAKHVTQRYNDDLTPADQQAIVTFLKTLRAPTPSPGEGLIAASLRVAAE